MPKKAPFKTGRICGFFNRNTIDDAQVVRRSCKGKSAKSSGLDRKTASFTNRRKNGCKTELFFLIICRFLRMSFFYPCPGISPQRRQAHIFAQSYLIRTVIQFSICPSIGRQREGPEINPFNNQLGTFLPFARKNFCNFFVNGSYNDKKSRYTAHQISGRKSLAFSLMKLCTGSEIQKDSMSAFFRSEGRHCTGTAQSQSLSSAAVSDSRP